jgi:hypothetical protein
MLHGYVRWLPAAGRCMRLAGSKYIEIDSSIIWREEIGNGNNRLVNLAGRNRQAESASTKRTRTQKYFNSIHFFVELNWYRSRKANI